MEYEIIFYHSGKTAECERLLEKRFSKLGLSALPSTAATDPASLASELQQALSCSDIVIIIGGLDGGRQSTDSILSQILSAEKERPDCEKLVDDNDNIAYFLKAGDQCIVVLPDETEVMEGMLDTVLICDLAGKECPEAATFHFEKMYGALVNLDLGIYDPEKAGLLTSLIAYNTGSGEEERILLPMNHAYTYQVLYRLGFVWPTLNEEYIRSFINALKGLGYFDLSEEDGGR